jgi:hypothetical protein
LLSEASLVQPPSQGWFNATSGTVSLPNPVTGGSNVVLLVAGFQPLTTIAPPNGFLSDFEVGSGGNRILSAHRPDIPAGETSWTLNSPDGQVRLYLWFLYEYASMDRASALIAQNANAGAGVSSLSTLTSSPSVSDDDLLVFAFHAGGGITTISNLTNGFVQEEFQSHTAGANIGSASVARLYPGVSGTFECTADYSPSATAVAGVLVYRSEKAAVYVPAVEVMSSSPTA